MDTRRTTKAEAYTSSSLARPQQQRSCLQSCGAVYRAADENKDGYYTICMHGRRKHKTGCTKSAKPQKCETLLFIWHRARGHTSALGFPTSSGRNRNCLFRLDTSIVSMSITWMLRKPLRAWCGRGVRTADECQHSHVSISSYYRVCVRERERGGRRRRRMRWRTGSRGMRGRRQRTILAGQQCYYNKHCDA